MCSLSLQHAIMHDVLVAHTYELLWNVMGIFPLHYLIYNLVHVSLDLLRK